MFRFSILLLTLSLLAVSPSVFGHDVTQVHPEYGSAISTAHTTETRSADNPWGASKWHVHKYTYAEIKLPPHPGVAPQFWTPTTTTAWPIVDGSIVSNLPSDDTSDDTDPPVDQPPVNEQPPVDQPPVDQPPVDQPPNNQPTVTQPTVTQPTTVATGGTPQGTSSPQPAGPVSTQSAPQERRPASPRMQPLYITEYMVRDWSKGGVRIGNSNLPQWIELYNPNAEAVNLKGWTFQYATRFFANHPYTIHTLTLAATEDGFSIPAGGVAILSTRQLRSNLPQWIEQGEFSGIEATQVYNLNIENVLKRGWVLTDATGREVQRIGRDAFSALRDPVAPRHQDGARVSYQAYRSESPPESYYYGDSRDIGSPGFYKSPPPAAPSLVKPKRIGTWARLKQTP